MTLEELERSVGVLQDRQAILDCLTRYCRAMDRLDRALLLTCYHEDAVDDHGIFLGGPEAFADWALHLHGTHNKVTQHYISNHSCELDGQTAHTETYYTYASMNEVGNPLTVCGGRYIDRLEKRGGTWAIARRVSILEWFGTPGEIFVSREKVDPDDHSHGSSRDHEDPSYQRPLQIKSKTAAFRVVSRTA